MGVKTHGQHTAGLDRIKPPGQSRAQRAGYGIQTARRSLLYAVGDIRHHQVHALRMQKRRRVARVTADHPQRAGVAVLKVFGRIGKDEFGLPSANPAAHGQRAFRLFVLDVVIFRIARQITGRLVHVRLGNLNAHPVIPSSQGKHQRCAAPRHGVADDQLAVMHAHKLA